MMKHEDFYPRSQKQSAKLTFDLRKLGKETAAEVVEEQAQAITDPVGLIVCCQQSGSWGMQNLCMHSTGQHYMNRPTGKKRQKLMKQLETVAQMP